MDTCSLKLGNASILMYNENVITHKKSSQLQLCYSNQFYDPRNKELIDLSHQFLGQSLVVQDQRNQSTIKISIKAQASICVRKALRWWDKSLKSNMIEIHSAKEFVDTLKNAGDKLVIVDFYSPGCGGCKSLHPKICQLAESNPDAIFLKVNYEELKPMCHALHIHVLPFFRFYRGAAGRVCSFSCTISTIKKFKDALAKHSTQRCSIGAAKGLDESELIKLELSGELTKNSTKPSLIKEGTLEEFVLENIGISNPLNIEAGKNAMLVA